MSKQIKFQEKAQIVDGNLVVCFSGLLGTEWREHTEVAEHGECLDISQLREKHQQEITEELV